MLQILTRYSSTPTFQLIGICANSRDAVAWEEFVSRFHRSIVLSVIRTARQWGGASPQVVDDLVQETYVKLCADNRHLLLAFATQHPDAVSGYIKTIAANLVHDYFKSRHSQKRGSGHAQESLEDLDPVAGSEAFGGAQSIERRVLLKEIDRFLDECSVGPEQERDRMIFWLYHQQGLSAKSIADLPTVGLTAKGVESAIFRLTRMIRERIVGLRSQSESSARDEKGLQSAESY